MVRGNKRSRSYRRIHVTTPGGRNVTHYELRKPSKPQCSGCGKELHGVARGRPADVRKLSKSQRRPERPYAGELCSSCLRSRLLKKIVE